MRGAIVPAMLQRLVVFVLAMAAQPGAPQLAPAHTTAFWQAIARNTSEPPAGTTAAQLAPELIGNLGSPDPELRDDLSMSILTAWIYQKKLLTADDLKPIVVTLRRQPPAAASARSERTACSCGRSRR